MDRKQKIMRLIIDKLSGEQQIEYSFIGAATTMDPNVISLEFVAKKGLVRGQFNVWGMIDMVLMLKAQYDSRSLLNNHPEIQAEIAKKLLEVSAEINRVI